MANDVLALVRHAVTLPLGVHFQNGHQLVVGIIRKIDILVEARNQAGVAGQKVVHFVGITCDNHHKVVAVILHQLDQRVDGLVAEIVVHALARQCVGFINE